MKRSRLNGRGRMWEPSEVSIVSTCRPWLTNIFQRHWERQEDRRVDLQRVKTALDVAKPSELSKILTLTGVHGHVTAAVLAEM